MNWLLENLRKQDNIVQPTCTKLHYENDFYQKTFVGGCVTLLVKGYIIYIALIQAEKMLMYKDPDILTIE